MHRHPGSAVGPHDGQWHPGADASRPGEAGARHPGSGGGVAHPGQDDAAYQHYGPGGAGGPGEGQWHEGGGAVRPGDAAHRHPGAGDAHGDPHSRPGSDPHGRLSGTAPLATAEDDATGSSRPTDLDEAIAKASAGGPLEAGLPGAGGLDGPDAVGAGGGGGAPYPRAKQSENVKLVVQVPTLAIT